MVDTFEVVDYDLAPQSVDIRSCAQKVTTFHKMSRLFSCSVCVDACKGLLALWRQRNSVWHNYSWCCLVFV